MTFDKHEKAKEKLRSTRNRLGVTWAEMSALLGGEWPPTSLSAWASNGDSTPRMPEDLADLVLAMAGELNPILDNPPAGTVAVFLLDGEWVIREVPGMRVCRYCGKLFIPHHPQQLYCTTYRGECGRAKRRERYGEMEQPT